MVFTYCVNAEEVVVIVHKDNPATELSRTQLIDLFMGKYVAFPDGDSAQPVDNDEVKAMFYKKLVNLSVARINAYWSRIKFSGRVKPPLEMNNDTEALSYVIENPNAIAYVTSSVVKREEVKIIYSFD